ncbi:FlaD/FlaE family flagellar protein [Natronorubrum halalkaliphilum]|nr:FlaD/FlaE family flagellar protein [Natronorubrum halalkaliphilum]
MGGDLSGSMGDDELLPGKTTTGGEMDDDDLFGGDAGGGDDDFLDDGQMDGEMSIDGMGGMDEMEGMDADDGGVSSEIEARVDEMENEVGSLASTVNTVQSENEKIGESLDDIEENIRKLLEVYEMVTQGVNPFVEGDSLSDTFGGGGGGGDAAGSGNFGGESLFDGDGTEAEDEAIDDDIASAEAEDFLDESIIDGEGEDEDDDFDDLDGESDAGDPLDGDMEDTMSMDSDSESDDAGDDLSFDELKSEYDSGEANWESDETDEADDEDDAVTEAFDDDDTNDAEIGIDDADAENDVEFEETPDDGDDLEFETDDAETDAAAGAELEIEDQTGDGTTDETAQPWDDGGRPYLETIPSEYNTEFVVMDWVEYLVEEAGVNGASRTIRFYGSIQWVSRSVEEHLQTRLNGFGGGPDIGEPEPRSSLGVDHKRSLWWISQIATPAKKRRSFEEWAAMEDEAGTEQVEITGQDGDDLPLEAGEELSYTESVGDEDLDRDEADELPVVDADAEADAESVGDSITEDSWDEQPDGRESDEESDTEMDGNSAQTILIDEAEDERQQRETDDSRTQPELADQEVNADGGQMIWVDTDIVLSESGARLCSTRNVYESGERDEYAKPLVVSDSATDMDGWQIEQIQLLLAPDDDGQER